MRVSWRDVGCCCAEQVDAAWQLASSVLQGAELRKALDYIIRALAEDCVHAQHQEGARTASSTGAAGRASLWLAVSADLLHASEPAALQKETRS